MSEHDHNDSISLESLAKIKNFIQKLTGVESFVASHEGLPIEEYGYDDPQKAEVEAALSEDLLKASSDIITSALGEKPPNKVSLLLKNDRSIDIIKINEIIITLKGQVKPLNEATTLITKYLKNKKIICPYCNTDLTLETYICPNCSATVPFATQHCPHCSTDLAIKTCPSCNNPITYDGRKVIYKEEISNRSLLIMDTMLVAIIGAMIGWLAQPTIISAVIGAMIGGGATYFILRNIFKAKKKIVIRD